MTTSSSLTAVDSELSPEPSTAARSRWLFTGDSITEWGRGDNTDPHDLGQNYVSALAAGPLAAESEAVEVLNTGVGGDRLADLAARWSHDVLDLNPDLLSVYIGVNDTWRWYDSGLLSPTDLFREQLASLLAPLAEAGTQLVLVSPFVLPALGEDRDWAEDLEPRISAIEAVASWLGAVYVPLQEPMEALADEVGAAAVAADGVHPTPAGHRLIADQWWRAWTDAHSR
ncbi:GDSL-type esterase/lipase family protein [Actinomyces urogenitalis]|uniref:GDSL-type esterase/lipase family protein n=1 Tax=Actinomyces urogenitalis TaxID=103621 RepID=UPI00242BAFB0|nr:GDSL-type esterase/lipase family protein [Actinomyces urogenitalis]MCI7456769.1 GDSL-type esterase/lipase family protein [Actinomyces urogenitalis]